MQSLFPLYLFYFLIQIHEQARVEEILYRDPESVAQLFNCRDRCAVVAPADDVIDGRLRDAAHIAQFIDGYVPLTTQLDDPGPNRFSDVHVYAPFTEEHIQKYLKRLTLLGYNYLK